MSGPLTSITKEHGLDMVARYQQGESVHSLSKAFVYSPDTVRKYLERNGVRIRGIAEAKFSCPPQYEPTLEQISEASAKIRSNWDEHTRLSRTVTKPIDFQTITLHSNGTRRGKDVSYRD